MERTLLTAIFIFPLLLFSCDRNSGPVQPAADGKSVTLASDPFCGDWAKGDSVSVLDNTGNHLFLADAAGPSAAFSGKGYPSAKSRVILSPYYKESFFSTSSLKFCVPALQPVYKPVSYASGPGPEYEMTALSASVSFNIVSYDVVSVTILGGGGEKIAGPGTVDLSSGEAKAAGDSESILVCPGDGRTLPVGESKVSVIPGSYPSGFRFKVQKAGGSVTEYSSDRAAVLRVRDDYDAGTVDDGFDEGPSQDMEVVFITNPGTASLVWPFATPSAGSVSSSAANGRASFQGVETVFALPESAGGYAFKAFFTGGIVKNSTQGFCVYGEEGDYLELPAIPGKLLSSVTIVSGNSSTALTVSTADGVPVTGGAGTCTFPSTGGEYTWDLFNTEQSKPYRLVLAGTSGTIQRLKLHYATVARPAPTGPLSPLDMGLREAQTGEERFRILSKTHSIALSQGREVDYSGVGTVDLVIPSDASPILIGKNTDFKGTVFNVLNTTKNMYLFTLRGSKKAVTVTGAQIDAADYRDTPILASGLHLLAIEDKTPWVENREGYDYGATRREAVLVRDGVGSNGPCAPYDTPATNHKAWYCVADDDQKTFCNVTMNRDAACTFKTFLVRFEMQNNIKVSGVTVNTPLSELYGDSCVAFVFCTNILMEDIVMDGNYSDVDEYGYSISCNAVWNSTFRRIRSNCRWAVFGCNNTHDSVIENCDIERFDTHCYGRNITMRDTHLRCKGLPAASIFGTILLERCYFEDCYLHAIRQDYNAYVDFDLIVKDCEITPRNTAGLVSMGRLDALVNSRPELEIKRWPNVSIDGLKVNVPNGAASVPLFYIGSNKADKPLGYISDISVKNLQFKYKSSSASTAAFKLCSVPVRVAADPFKFSFSGSSLKPSSTSAKANVYVNIHGVSDSISVNDTDVEVITD